MAEMMGESWHYLLRLEVLADAADIADDWEPDWSGDLVAEVVAERSPEPEPEPEMVALGDVPSNADLVPEPDVASELVQPLVSLDADRPDADLPTHLSIAEPAEPVAESVAQERDEFGLGEFEADMLDQPLAASSLPKLQVILEQEVFVIQRGEALSLTGRVEFPAEYPSDWQPAISELLVRLYDPQTSQLLMDEVYPIDNRIPPFPFSGTVSLPEHYQTYLVLGELILQGMTPAGTPQLLAQQSFNVTTDLHELIESIANDFPDLSALPLEAQMPEPEPIPLAELNRLAVSFQRSPQQPLPPQLRPYNPTRTHAELDLPSFGSADAVVANAETPGEPVAEHAENPAIELAELTEISTSAADLQPLDPSQNLLEAPLQSDSVMAPSELSSELSPVVLGQLELDSKPESQSEAEPDTKLAEPSELFSGWSEIESRLPIWRQPLSRPAVASDKPEDLSFRALNIQERFWSRLQVLATNPALSAELADADFSALTAPEQRQRGLDADLTLHEVVVDDEPTISPTPSPSPLPAELQSSGEDFLSEFVLPENEPIPTPRLQLPQGELVAEQPIAIIVKLPNLKARVYVKLWLRDRQTRSMLGAARWLIDFLTDGFGNQMARTEVIVPPGYLKVQFEAIAVEIATQRESDKVTMTRPIVPPDLSPLSLDRLEI